MTSSLLSDRAGLQQRLGQLTRDRASAGDRGFHAEATAECCFRLAVHPETPAEDALRFLHRAVRLDGGHPKHAFHLARLLLAHGQLHAAQKWLSLAHRLCPTSHRIWAHIGLLQRQLNLGYRGDPRYVPDGLRTRAETLAQLIIAGEDHLPDPALVEFDPPPAAPDPPADSETERTSGSGVRESDQGATARRGGGASPVRRFTAPGRCRWSGIADCQAEEVLQREPSPRSLKVARRHLERAARQAGDRREGVSRFAILAMQWIVAGYPVATIRRLTRGRRFEAASSLELLELVCRLYEAAEEEVPAMLAAALRGNALPPALAALVHRQRLLQKEYDFPRVDAYCMARQLLEQSADVGGSARGDGDTGSEEDAAKQMREYAAGLSRAAAAVGGPLTTPLVDPGSDATADGRDAGSPLEALERLHQQAQALLSDVVDAAWIFLRDDLQQRAGSPKSRSDVAKVEADGNALEGLIEQIKGFAEAGQGRRTDLSAGVRTGGEIDPAEAARRIEECARTLDRLGSLGRFARSLSRVRQRAMEARERLGLAGQCYGGEPSPALLALLERAERICGLTLRGDGGTRNSNDDASPGDRADVASDEDPADAALDDRQPAGREAAPIADEDRPTVSGADARATGAAALAAAIRAVDTRLAESFDAADATFRCYGEDQRELPPLRNLAGSLRDRRAQVLFRLGHRSDARRTWHGLLATHGFQAAILKNIAVCDTLDGDVGRALASWNLYLEFLYALDIGIATPRLHARQRADCHRILGDACAPAFLCAEYKPEWPQSIDRTALLSFFESPGRLRCFVRNKWLEFLNARLAFASPPRVLGVARSEGAGAREGARDALIGFMEEAAASLPPAVRSAFSGLVSRHAEDAHEACSSFLTLSGKRDYHYKEEEQAFRRLLTEFAQLKYKLLLATQSNDELARYMSSIDFLNELMKLDDIPLAQSLDLLRPVAGSLRIDPAKLARSVREVVRNHVVDSLLRFVFSAGESSKEQAQREQQYRRLIGGWVDQPAFAGFRDLIDDPQPYYPRAVRSVLRGGGEHKDAIDSLLDWAERFPELTGPRRLLAQLLDRGGRTATALEILTDAISRGFHRARVVTCYHDRMLLRWNLEAPGHRPGPEEPEWVHAVRRDAEHVARHSRREQELKLAREILKRSRAAG